MRSSDIASSPPTPPPTDFLLCGFSFLTNPLHMKMLGQLEAFTPLQAAVSKGGRPFLCQHPLQITDRPCLGPVTCPGPIAGPRSYASCLKTLQNHAHWRRVRTSGVLLSGSQPALVKGGGEPWFEAFADFCGVVIPPMAGFKLPT